MMYHRVTIITRKIPLNVIITAIYESESLRPYVGFDNNFQYNWFILEDEPKLMVLSTDDLNGFGEITLDPIPSHIYFMHLSHRNYFTNPFPAHCLNIFNYSFTVRGNASILRDKSDLIKEIKNVCNRNNIPDDQTKCVIFYKDIAVYSFEDETGHFLDFSDHRDVYKLTLFYDEKVNAFPVYIYEGKTGYTTIKEKLQRLKYCELKIVQKRCFAYIFHDSCTECMDPTTRAFREIFPLVKYVTHNFLPFYLSIIPSEIEYSRIEHDYLILCTTIMVFVWW
ncbi:uncharacterized protein LOC111637394 [Centruroides sculpturatus]|uniref:uncharacterized protein LOC111637394 n=1 Tax=Centruroides sculpturatus TaxID=218467 RepID=UPI000C6E5087|nr:uncharacterized protein LOC111637394 [Centruroides sculpturatus]